MPPVDDATNYQPLREGSKNAPRGTVSRQFQRVLIVDDDEVLRKSIGRLLQSRGIEAILAQNGEEGLALFDMLAGVVDVVLMDKDMPKMDGLTTLGRMRELHSHIPVVVYSGDDDQQWARAAMSLGAKATVQKPFLLEDLLFQLNLVVNSSQQ